MLPPDEENDLRDQINAAYRDEIARLLRRVEELQKVIGAGYTLRNALEITDLSEEEAYFILRFAGHLGYDRAIKRLSDPLKVIRQWFVWVGGWEHSELSQWDRGEPAWEPRNQYGWRSPTPLSFFGHRVTINGPTSEKWIEFKVGRGYLRFLYRVFAKRFEVYWTPNGTPWHKDAIFFIGKRPMDLALHK